MSRFVLIFSLSLISPLAILAQYQDYQVPGVVEAYFNRNHTAPTLIRAGVSEDPFYGHMLKIKIQGNRNTANDDLGFAFGAAAAVAAKANKSFDTLWVEMDVRYKEIETTIAIAPAECSIETIVYKTQTFGHWWDHCLELL